MARTDPADRIAAALDVPPGRRTFIKVTFASVVSVSALGSLAGTLGGAPFVILENAEGMLAVDTTRCTGCGRCELACTEFNDGRAQPSLARVKVSRNYPFGPRGQQAGVGRGLGEYGNFRVVPDTCLQCAHPVPCEAACPNAALVLEPRTRARMVDVGRCTGCRLCSQSCPWEMMSFDSERAKATKCWLCAGAPECVAACPTGALRYVPWRDLAGAVPVRRATTTVIQGEQAESCTGCYGKKSGTPRAKEKLRPTPGSSG
jgi:Fe-S-cluster-containing dehydrogenase component